jgi:hypothetical protein
MSSVSQAFRAHLAGETTTLCYCWRVTRRDGAVSGYTDHDMPLLIDGTLYQPETGFSASEARDRLGLGTDTSTSMERCRRWIFRTRTSPPD